MRHILLKKIKRTWLLAIIGAPVIGLVSSAILTIISSTLGIKSEGLDVFQKFVDQAVGIEIFYIVLVVGVIMPVIEELIFRGLLWKILKLCRLPETGLFLITSILFAAAHIDPMHVLGVLPLAIFLGWLRLKTNSITPGIFAHMSNNLVACALMLL